MFKKMPCFDFAVKLYVLSLIMVLAGCGGGGSDMLGPQFGGGAGSSTGGLTQALNIASIKLVDMDGNSVDTVTVDGVTVKVKVVDGSGQSVDRARVSFAVDSSGVTVTGSTSGSVLTNSDGVAQTYLKPDSADVFGAYTITVTAEKAGVTDEASGIFSVQPTNIVLTNFNFDDTNLKSGGQTSFNILVSDESGNPAPNTTVSFVASCGEVTPQQSSDVNGLIQGTYKSMSEDGNLCKDTVTVTASTPSTTPVSSELQIEAPSATSIIYSSTENISLGIKGSGSAATGQIEFTVFSNQTPLPNAQVTLSLEKSPLGFSFGTDGNLEDFVAKTDDEGKVAVNLYPGTTPGPVEIRATLVGDTEKTALSKGVTVASSRVSQPSFSVSVSTNVADWTIDGVEIEYTARLADRSGNPVPDGTVVNFVSEGGQIGSSCATAAGVCSVRLYTQDYRPIDGRISVLAVVEGEKQFIDANKNNAWDAGEEFKANIGDTFRDDNEDGIYNDGEFIYPLRTSSNGACSPQSMANVYPNISGTCNQGLDAILRSQSIQLLTSDDTSITELSRGAGSFSFKVNSAVWPLNPPPRGTTVSVETIDRTDNEASCAADIIGGQTPVGDIQNTGKKGDDLGLEYYVSLDQCVSGDLLKITVTSGQTKTIQTYSL